MDNEILKDFVDESIEIVKDCLDLLESVEGDYTKVGLLDSYGNNLDRIMGGASTLALDTKEDNILHLIADYSALCKNVAYKASQIKVNEPFFDVCVGFLIDATEVLQSVLKNFEKPTREIKNEISEEFINRLKWVFRQFNEKLRSTVDLKSIPTVQAKNLKSTQEIESILLKLSKK